MQYATLGNTGLVVSRLAFGAMTFTSGNQDFATVYKVGAQAANELVARSLDAGVNFFNTADAYAGGQSEALLGQALKSRRNAGALATQVAPRPGPARARRGACAPPERRRDRGEGRDAQRPGDDTVRTLPSPHPVVGR